MSERRAEHLKSDWVNPQQVDFAREIMQQHAYEPCRQLRAICESSLPEPSRDAIINPMARLHSFLTVARKCIPDFETDVPGESLAPAEQAKPLLVSVSGDYALDLLAPTQ